jgi:hypothetical protein
VPIPPGGFYRAPLAARRSEPALYLPFFNIHITDYTSCSLNGFTELIFCAPAAFLFAEFAFFGHAKK